MLKIILFLGMCLGLSQSWAKLTVDVSPSRPSLHESIRLTITVNEQQLNSTPNLINLQKDFYIIGTEHNMSYVINQGVATTMNQWIIVLQPRKVGTIIIPSIAVGNEHSQPTKINVSNNGSVVSNQSASITTYNHNPVTLQIQATPKKPYINQEVIYTVTLMSKERILQANYQPPSADEALMLTLGNSRHYETEINGESFDVEEQTYAFFPQKSGALTIKPPSFHGVVYDIVPRPIDATAHSVVLHVKPAASLSMQNTTWLPATYLRLQEAPINHVLKEGEPVNRTITIESHDLPAELLPNLSFANTDAYRVYTNKPELHNDFQQQALQGRETLTITYIMTKAGQITWPAIDVPWFNTQTKKIMHAALPAQTFTVLPKNNTPIIKSHITQVQKKSIHVITKRTKLKWVTKKQIFILTLATFILLILISLLRAHHQSPNRRLKKQLHRVKKACLLNDPHQAQLELITWAQLKWPSEKFLNLADVANMLNDLKLKNQLQKLSNVLYNPQYNHKTWSGKSLWQHLRSL